MKCMSCNSLLCVFSCLFILIQLNSGNSAAQDLGALKTRKPFTINGNLSAHGLFYNMSGAEARSNPFSYLFNGNLNISVYGVEIPLSFVYSEKERSFRQPFNQFGLSPKYKWITLHGGFRSLNFSSYTMAGYSVLGGGAELNPGKFRFGFIYGRFNRAASGTGTGQADPTPAYKRNGFSVKIGYGTPKSFFDIILLKAKDDNTSLFPDSTNGYLSPAENIVTGYNSKIEFNKQWSFESEGSLSSYTSNTGADTTAENTGMTVRLFKSLITTNATTSGSSAFRAGLSYRLKIFSMKLQYRRVSPGYKSMGTYYIASDYQNITLEPAFSLLKQKLNIRSAIGLQNDNLDKNKKATSTRTIGSLSFNYNPSSKFGIDGNFSNLSTSQKAGTIPLVDSAKILQSNMNVMLTPRLVFANAKRAQVIMLSYNYMVLNDNNEKTQNLTEYTIHNIFLNYVLSLVEKNLSISLGVNSASVKFTANSTSVIGFSATLSKSLMNGKLSLTFPAVFQNSKFQTGTSRTINFFPGASYQLWPKHSLSLNCGYIGNFSDMAGQSFNEIRGDFGYTYTF